MVAPLAASASAMLALAGAMGSHAGLAFCALLVTMLAWAPGGILAAYPSSYLSGPAAASGYAMVNAVGSLLGGARGTLAAAGCLLSQIGWQSQRAVCNVLCACGGGRRTELTAPEQQANP